MQDTTPPESTNIRLALSDPRNVWRLFHAMQRIAGTEQNATARNIATSALLELEQLPAANGAQS